MIELGDYAQLLVSRSSYGQHSVFRLQSYAGSASASEHDLPTPKQNIDIQAYISYYATYNPQLLEKGMGTSEKKTSISISIDILQIPVTTCDNIWRDVDHLSPEESDTNDAAW